MRAAVALVALIGQGYALPALSATLGWFLGVLWRLLDETVMSDPKPRGNVSKDQIKIVSDEEAENADICVCMPVGPSRFNDNELGACNDCGMAIMFRPSNPKKPVKVCIDCGMRRAGISEEEIARHRAAREASKGA